MTTVFDRRYEYVQPHKHKSKKTLKKIVAS